MSTPGIPLERQLRCAQRELRLRRQVYPKLVEARRLTQQAADQEIACMEAIIHTLEGVLASQQLSLFPRDSQASDHDGASRGALCHAPAEAPALSLTRWALRALRGRVALGV